MSNDCRASRAHKAPPAHVARQAVAVVATDMLHKMNVRSDAFHGADHSTEISLPRAHAVRLLPLSLKQHCMSQ